VVKSFSRKKKTRYIATVSSHIKKMLSRISMFQIASIVDITTKITVMINMETIDPEIVTTVDTGFRIQFIRNGVKDITSKINVKW
jgi:hypothetical protein